MPTPYDRLPPTGRPEQFSILALDVPSLQLTADNPAALVGFTMRLHIIAEASLTATARQ